jgi:hypothetical protein
LACRLFALKPALKFLWKHVLQLELEAVEDGLQLVERDVVFSFFQAVQSGVRYAREFGKIGVGERPSPFAQELRELSVQVSPHAANVPGIA